MKEIIKKGQIYFEYNGLTFNVCQIYEKRVGDSYIFTFEPNYKVIDIIPPSANFEGIQGLNLDLKQNIYERTGIPTFVSERIPPKNREELYMILEKNNLNYYDPFDLMIISKQKYCGDNLKVRSYIEKKRKDIKYKDSTDIYPVIKDVLNSIANNDDITIDGQSIDVKELFNLFYPVYHYFYNKKRQEQLKSVNNRTYRGRKQIAINNDDFMQIWKSFKTKDLSIDEAIRVLGISKSTFFRKAKSLKIKLPTNETS